MATELRAALAGGTEILGEDGGGAVLSGRGVRLPLGRPSGAAFEALRALVRGATDARLVEIAGRDAPWLFYRLEIAAERGLIQWSLFEHGQRLLTLSPVSLPFSRAPANMGPERVVALSRFSAMKPCRGTLALENPLSCGLLEVHDPRVAALLFGLCTPRRVADLADARGGLEPGSVLGAVTLLAEASMLEPELGTGADQAALALRQWEPHDLAFHARTRHARLDVRSGGTYRFEGEIEPLPAVKPPRWSDGIDLDPPDMDAHMRDDPPFSEVLERRRSTRSGRAAMDVRALGELLHRSARVRRVLPSPKGELTDRPYPGAGAVYELEIYPVVRVCEGLARGLYHYCPARHHLERVAGETAEVAALLAAAAPAPASPPDVLLVIAARFARASYKYENISYSLILKDTGALMMTAHLVATAMGLAMCPLGRGDAGLFCRAAGLDPRMEGSVGEIALFGRGDG
jgi:oxazoline/thiazoline dehydrogenase